DRHGAPPYRAVELTYRQRGIVQEQVPLSLVLDDAGMDREAVLARSGELAPVCPRPLDRGCRGVGDFLVAMRRAVERSVGQVVEIAALVQPRPFLEMWRGDLGDRPVDLDHVRLEPGGVAMAVAPGGPGGAVGIGAHRWSDGFPGVRFRVCPSVGGVCG